jgi:hypothetical protein
MLLTREFTTSVVGPYSSTRAVSYDSLCMYCHVCRTSRLMCLSVVAWTPMLEAAARTPISVSRRSMQSCRANTQPDLLRSESIQIRAQFQVVHHRHRPPLVSQLTIPRRADRQLTPSSVSPHSLVLFGQSSIRKTCSRISYVFLQSDLTCVDS